MPVQLAHTARIVLLLVSTGLSAPAQKLGQAPTAGATRPIAVPLSPSGPSQRAAPDQSNRPPESLAEVRALFARVDADKDGRLDRREADHGGADAGLLARCDRDRDGKLDGDEFCVARQRALCMRGQRGGPDLISESTRIQALWRARTAQAQRNMALSLTTLPEVPPASPPRSPFFELLTADSRLAWGPARARLSPGTESGNDDVAERERRVKLLVEARQRQRQQR
jgi:hypothetical protein